MNIIERFDNAKQVLYDHIGFIENYLIYPIVNRTETFWQLSPTESSVKFAKEKFISSDGKYYFNLIFTNRYYNKSIYHGKELTMIFVDLTIDNIKYFAFFSNDKEIK